MMAKFVCDAVAAAAAVSSSITQSTVHHSSFHLLEQTQKQQQQNTSQKRVHPKYTHSRGVPKRRRKTTRLNHLRIAFPLVFKCPAAFLLFSAREILVFLLSILCCNFVSLSDCGRLLKMESLLSQTRGWSFPSSFGT